MNVAIIGTGYVGLVAGVGFAELGHTVTCVDKDEEKIALLRSGKSPIYEEGLEALLEKHGGSRLTFTTSLENALAQAQVVLLAVGTPSRQDGSADLRYVEEAVKGRPAYTVDWSPYPRPAVPGIRDFIQPGTTLVTKSTVPVGTAAKIREWLGNRALDVDVVSNPEFLREGSAVEDFLNPDRVVFGIDDPEGRGAKAVARMKALYTWPYQFGVNHPEIIVMSSNASAELTKYACNGMLATRISFMNEIAQLADATGADVTEIARGVGSDRRIGPAFLEAGAGFQGSCLIGSETVLVRLQGEVSLETLEDVYTYHQAHPDQRLEVLSHDRNHQPSFQPISAATKRRYEGPLYTITTKMGRRVRCTDDHPFVTMDGTGKVLGDRLARDLTTEMWLPLPVGTPLNQETKAVEAWDVLSMINIPPEKIILRFPEGVVQQHREAIWQHVESPRRHEIMRGDVMRLDEARRCGMPVHLAAAGTNTSGNYVPTVIPNNEDLWYSLGLFAAEGHISYDNWNKPSRGIRQDAQGTRARIQWSLAPVGEEHFVQRVAGFLRSVGIDPIVDNRPTSRIVQTSSRILAEWMRAIGLGLDSYDQTVPDVLWTQPLAFQRAFLQGYWHGDGSWGYATGGERGMVLQAATVSPRLADGILRIFANMGIVAAQSVRRVAKSTVDTYWLDVSGANQVENLVDFVDPVEQDEARAAIAKCAKRILPTGYRKGPTMTGVRIRDIETAPFQGDVFSLEVPGVHTFVTTGGITVHNCFHKDIKELCSTAKSHGLGAHILKATLGVNHIQEKAFIRSVFLEVTEVQKKLGPFAKPADVRVAIWGLAFKPGTDDVRESVGIKLAAALRANGYTVIATDPEAIENAKREMRGVNSDLDYWKVTLMPWGDTWPAVKATVEGAHVLVIPTPWPQFLEQDMNAIGEVMAQRVLIDGRNKFRHAAKAGFRVIGIGVPDAGPKDDAAKTSWQTTVREVESMGYKVS